MPAYKKIEIKFDDAPPGVQGVMLKLEVDLKLDDGTTVSHELDESDSGAGPVSPVSHNILWGNSSCLCLIEGSICIVMGGKRYCFG